jgi:hypothetical protein
MQLKYTVPDFPTVYLIALMSNPKFTYQNLKVSAWLSSFNFSEVGTISGTGYIS